jgi:hypothetical protein
MYKQRVDLSINIKVNQVTFSVHVYIYIPIELYNKNILQRAIQQIIFYVNYIESARGKSTEIMELADHYPNNFFFFLGGGV